MPGDTKVRPSPSCVLTVPWGVHRLCTEHTGHRAGSVFSAWRGHGRLPGDQPSSSVLKGEQPRPGVKLGASCPGQRKQHAEARRWARMLDLVRGVEGIWCCWRVRWEGGRSQRDKATGAGSLVCQGFSPRALGSPLRAVSRKGQSPFWAEKLCRAMWGMCRKLGRKLRSKEVG